MEPGAVEANLSEGTDAGSRPQKKKSVKKGRDLQPALC